MTRRAFTLVELLVTIAIVGVLIGALLPALAASREAARSARCMANLREAYSICRIYADNHGGTGPAIGQPWGELPNWALLVMERSGSQGDGPGELYSSQSVLVCPTIQAFYPQEMTRTYAMNATGHAGLPEDPDSYDDAQNPAHIRFNLVERASDTPLLMDSAVAFFPSDAPPPTRSASVLDFRQEDHVADRLGRFHGGGEAFNIAAFDGSVQSRTEIADHWRDPLP